MDALGRLAPVWVIVAQVGIVVLAWRLVIWVVRGRDPWREPPRRPWRRSRDAALGPRWRGSAR